MYLVSGVWCMVYGGLVSGERERWVVGLKIQNLKSIESKLHDQSSPQRIHCIDIEIVRLMERKRYSYDNRDGHAKWHHDPEGRSRSFSRLFQESMDCLVLQYTYQEEQITSTLSRLVL